MAIMIWTDQYFLRKQLIVLFYTFSSDRRLQDKDRGSSTQYSYRLGSDLRLYVARCRKARKIFT